MTAEIKEGRVASAVIGEANSAQILIIHEDEAVRAQLAQALASTYRLREAAYPPDGYDASIDLILSDRECRPPGARTPLILLGRPGLDSSSTPQIDDFLSLPVAPDELHDRIGLALLRSKRLAEAGEAERRRTIQALKESRESRERLTRLLELAPIGIAELSIAGGVSYINPAAERLMRLKRTELEGRYYLDPEVMRLTPDGQPIPPDQFPVSRSLRGETVIAYEMAVVDPRNGDRFVISVNTVPLRDEEERITGVLAVFSDLTARHLAESELRRLAATLEERVAGAIADREHAQETLLQAQKLESIGQLTGGVAHDFNNVLTAIAGNLDLVRLDNHDGRLDQLLESALRSVDRGAKLTEQLLAYARKQRLVPKPVDLNLIIDGMTEMLGRTLGGTVEVRTELAPDLWSALVDPTQMELVLMNLAINSRDAMPEGGVIVIRTCNAMPDTPDRPADLVAGDYVVLEVADNGTGMSEEVMERAFEPFFTTKGPGKGSGLGLSQIHGLAYQSGGTVRLRSRLGEGTVVQIYLPRTTDAVACDDAVEGAGTAQSRQAASILVVDDQEDVREVLAAQLESFGHRVFAVSSGREALDFLDGGEAVDLLVVDYAMPGMTGLDLVNSLRRDRPRLAFIMITGYADADLIGKLDGLALLRKPYRLAELAREVNGALRRILPAG